MGSIRPSAFKWKKADVNIIDLANSEIFIIHSDDIKVHYKNVNLIIVFIAKMFQSYIFKWAGFIKSSDLNS